MYDRQVRRRRITLIVLVVVSLVLLTAYFGESPSSPLHTVQRGVIQVLSPIQEGASRALKPARDLFGWFGDTANAKKERDQLRAQRDQLLRRQIEYDVAMQENVQLKRLVNLRKNYDLSAYRPVTARIFNRSTMNLFRNTIGVNEGTSAGVRVGDAVIAGDGLVGHISMAASNSSVVTLITDLRSTVAGRLLNGKNRGDFGLVRASPGNPRDLLMQQVEKDIAVEVGAVVVTAGTIADRLASPYPPNIPIGRVTEVDPDELYSRNQIRLAPIVDLRHLQFVEILTGGPDRSGAQAEVEG